MRVAIINSFYQSESPSGENQAVVAQVAALERAGHEVTLISQHSDDFRTDGTSYRVSRAWQVSTGFGSTPELEIAKFKPDIIHIHNLFPNWGFRWIDRVSAPKVWSVHNFRPICAAGTLYRDGSTCIQCPTRSSVSSVVHKCYRSSMAATVPLAISTNKSFPRQFVTRRVQHVLFLSDHQYQTYKTLTGFKGPSTVVPNFMPDLHATENSGVTPAGWCYIGRISEEKGVFDLVQSWPQGVRLGLYGNGPGVDRLRSMLTRDMVFHGAVPNHRVHDVLQRHEGLVFPSKVSEISPLTYIEALRAGRPAVAFGANAAARDILSSSCQIGEVFESWDDLPKALMALEGNLQARRHARARYEEKFSEGAWLSAIEAVYESVSALQNYDS